MPDVNLRSAYDVTLAYGSFVGITREKIRHIHASAEELLLSKGVYLSLDISQPGSRTERALGAMHIGRACLTCLVFSDILYVGDTASNDTLRLRIQNHIQRTHS